MCYFVHKLSKACPGRQCVAHVFPEYIAQVDTSLFSFLKSDKPYLLKRDLL